jgi:hypothetical protein
MLTATPGRMAPLLSTARPGDGPGCRLSDGWRRASHEQTCR